MTTNQATTSTIDKIKKLFAQANHQNTTDTEAEVFRQKAFELMMKHGVTEDEIRAKADTFTVVQKRIKLKTTTWREDVVLGGIVARANGAFHLYTAYTSWGGAWIIFAGPADTVEVCEFMFNMLLAQRALASRRRKNKRETQREFASGFNVGVNKTFHQAVKQSDGSLLPALQSMRDRIAAMVAHKKGSGLTTAQAGAQGYAAGLTADSGIRQRVESVTQRGIGAGS